MSSPVWTAHQLRWTLRTVLDSNLGGDPLLTGRLECKYRNATVEALGLLINSARGTSTTTTTFSLGAGFSGSIPSHVGANSDDWTWQIILTGFKLLSTLRWTASLIEVYREGVLHHSATNISFTDSSGTAAGVGSIGMGPRLSVALTAGTVTLSFSPGPPSYGTYEAEGEAHVEGGFDFKITSGDSWSTFATTLPAIPATSTFPAFAGVPKPYGLTWPSGMIGGSNSAGLSASAYYHRTWAVYGSPVNQTPYSYLESWSGEIALVSNEKPVLHRLTTDSEGRLSRAAIPLVEGSGQCYTLDVDNYPAYTYPEKPGALTYGSVLPALTSTAADFTDTPGAIETDLLTRDHPCWAKVNYVKSDSRPRPFPGPYNQSIPYVSESYSWEWPTRVNSSTVTPQTACMDGVLHRWGAFICPRITPSINGVVQPVTYSVKHRMGQLSGGEIYRMMLGEMGGASLIGTLTGQPGIWHTIPNAWTPTASASYSAASSALYTAPAGAMTLITGGASFTGGSAKIDLVSLSAPPYAYGLLADSISLTVTGSALRYFLQDAMGNQKEVFPSGGVIDLTLSLKRPKPCGTWGQEWGLRAVVDSGLSPVSDIYPDIQVDGQTDQIWPDVDAERALMDQLGASGSWASLLITGTGTITITHPVLSRSSALKVWHESPEAFWVGTGDRWARLGGTAWPTAATLPYIEWPGRPPTNPDWLVWKRLVLEGRAPDDGILTEIASINESVSEGLTFSAAAALDTRALPVFGTEDSLETPVLLKSWRQANRHPHLMGSPLDPVTLQPSLGATLDRHIWSRKGSMLAGFDCWLDLYDSGGAMVSTHGTQIGSLWPSLALPSSFAKDHELRVRHWAAAQVRPVYGFSGHLFTQAPASPPRVACVRTMHYQEASEMTAGSVRSARDFRNPGASGVDQGLIVSGDIEGFDLLPRSGGASLLLLYSRAGSVYAKLSNDDGSTWGTEVAILTDAVNPRALGGNPEVVVGFREDGDGLPGVLVGVSQEPGGSAWSSEFILQTTSGDLRIEPLGFDITEASRGHGWILVAVAEGEAEVSRWISHDGCRSWAPA